MTKKTIAIFLSLLVAAMPFLGFPEEIDRYFYLIAGLIVAGLIELVSIQYCSQCGQLCSAGNEVLDKYQDPRTGVVEEVAEEPQRAEADRSDEPEEVLYYDEVIEESEPDVHTHTHIHTEVQHRRKHTGEEA